MTKTTPSKHLVLYADDDQDDIRFIEEAFDEHVENIEVVALADGGALLSYLKNLSVLDADPCLIILDINMPGLNGKETLLKIRQMKRFEKTPVVLFSTSSLPQDIAFASRNAAGFITKPLDSRQMQKITEQFIEHCNDEIRRNILRRTN